MRTSLKLLAAALSCTTLLPASAQALNFVDAAHPRMEFWTPWTIFLGTNPMFFSYSQRLAQTLTVEAGGMLAGVFLPIDCTFGAYSIPTGQVYMEIRDVAAGLPGPTLLEAYKVNANRFDADGRFTFLPLSGTVLLAAGQQIAIVLDARGGACELRPSLPLTFPGASNYMGGEGFFEVKSGVWTPLSTILGCDDIPFQLVLQ